VRDEHQRAGILEQPGLEPRNGIDVEVVGGLVEDEHVGLGDERARQQHATAPPTGERIDRDVARQAQAIEDHLDALLDPPAIALVELVLQAAEAFQRGRRRVVGHVVRGVMVGGDHLAQRAEAFGDDVEDRLVGGKRDVLLETRHDDARLPPEGAAVRRQRTGDDFQQRRLAGAVATDDGDPLAAIDLKGDAIEKRQVTKGDRDRIQGE
jgi:hypothetical protein